MPKQGFQNLGRKSKASTTPSLGAGQPLDEARNELEYPLPESNNLDDIVAVVREILMQGSVKRIVIESGYPIRVLMDEQAQMDANQVDFVLIGDKLQTVPLEELGSSPSPLIAIAKALEKLSSKHLHGTFIAARVMKDVSLWYSGGKTEDLSNIMGMSIHEVPDFPDEVLVVCGCKTKIATPFDIAMGYKVPMELERKKK